jgi:hypothetical protein
MFLEWNRFLLSEGAVNLVLLCLGFLQKSYERTFPVHVLTMNLKSSLHPSDKEVFMPSRNSETDDNFSPAKRVCEFLDARVLG